MSLGRPALPAETARRLRQISGFGCCRCGSPIVQYHHIVRWSVEQHFRVEDMMVLCPACHDMATKGAFTEGEERAMQASPHNISRGYASGLLVMQQPYAAIRCGTCLLVGDGLTISIDQAELLRIGVSTDRRLELSIDLRRPDGEQVGLIDRNEWLSGDASAWDVVADYRRLKLWSAQYKIALELDATKVPVLVRADLHHAGSSVLLSPSALAWGRGANPKTFVKAVGLLGISLAVDSHAQTLAMSPYLGEGLIIGDISGPDALEECLHGWQRLNNQGIGLGL